MCCIVSGMVANDTFDVLVIGAGPTGLACGIEAQRRRLRTVVVDKGCVVNSLFHYPAGMVFFTTPELLEIGDMPFSSAHQKPTREEALAYYRKVAQHYGLDIRQYQRVTAIKGQDGGFFVSAFDQHERPLDYYTRKLILATGYYDLPNIMGIPGEELPKVTHYYREAHPYSGSDVLIIGAKNSAAISALDLYRHGARVTLVHRGPGISASVKYWIKPDIENRIKNGEIKAYFNSSVGEIRADDVLIQTPDGELRVKNDFVLALTGYHPDFDFLRGLGIRLSPDNCRPVCDPQTLESNVPGIYLAGVIVAGSATSEIFIENGRFHGRQIATDLERKLRPNASPVKTAKTLT
ncbi:MAG: YpdA family putative bacillithiol disulfide reductase [Terriglobales bacterium]